MQSSGGRLGKLVGKHAKHHPKRQLRRHRPRAGQGKANNRQEDHLGADAHKNVPWLPHCPALPCGAALPLRFMKTREECSCRSEGQWHFAES
ncbi:MAG: hypothetical protein OXF25_03530 [Cyanobacteria bacterium MAG CAR3_bin_5]|nr:hypothetical protein [Cyanobacteria bacterium MAG CAR3_bin_5]